MLSKIKVLLSISVILTITACSPKKYSFEVDAPPKYSNKHIFKSMSIKNFKSDKPNYKDNFISTLKNGIAREGYIKIVHHGEEVVLSGFLNVGKVYSNTVTDSYECKKKKVKKTCYSYTHKKTHTLKVDYTLSKVSNNSVIYGDTITEDFSDSWFSLESAAAAKGSATSDTEIINKALSAVAQKIVHAVSPHKETVSRELQEGNSDNIALGITYIENGRVEQALAIWDQCIAKSTSAKNKAAAYYNIGVIKESKGSYRDAFSLYSNANSLLPKEELYIKAMTRVEKLNKKTKKLRQWKSR